MSMVNLVINNKNIQVEKGTSILSAAKKLNIDIPTLCHMYMADGKTRNCKGTCRVCVVEVEGREDLVPSCAVDVSEGMVVKTHSPKAVEGRKTMVELLLSNHPQDCLKCEKNLRCELQKLAVDLGVGNISYMGEITERYEDRSSCAIIRDMNKCILCRRCVTVCNEVQNVNALTMVDRGFNSLASTFLNKPLAETNCTYCGQCVAVCPTAALREVKDYENIWSLLNDKDKYVIVQTAPAVRVALGEEFGLEVGTVTTRKMAGALKTLGFQGVYDTNFAADLTIMEEATEFIERFTKNENLPLITSCCPAWINFIEKKYPEHLNLPSSCKSPQQMFGAIAKTYLAQKLGISPEKIVLVSVMPCIAKKYEANREEMSRNGIKDVDIVITTRELARMLKEAGININTVEEADFDSPLGRASGAGVIFGSTGGVMEAALRTSYEWVTGNELKNVNFEEVRGLDGIKEATVNLNGKDVNVAVVSSLGNAKKIMDEIKAGNSKYHFIEVMACPGGCIDGGGQPFIKGDIELLKKRMKGIYQEDSNNEIRKSHENPMIKALYEEFLEKPNSHLAHELLHTTYKNAKK